VPQFFGFGPTGTSPITERWRWLTDVMAALSGAQIRVSLRDEPQLELEYDTASGDFAYLLDALITAYQADTFYVPVWQDRALLGAAVGAGASSLPATTAGLAYLAGGFAAVWTDPQTFEVVEIASVGGSAITLADPTAEDWPATAQIAPVRLCRMAPEAGASRFTGDALEARVVFETEDPVTVAPAEWGAGAGGPWTIDGLSLFNRAPNWEQDPRSDYSRRLRELGGVTGPRWQDDPSGRSWILRTEQHTCVSRAEIEALKSWYAQRRGRCQAYLAPVWESGLAVTRSNSSGDTQLYITNRGYATLYPGMTGRGYVALQDANGWRVRKISSISAVDADEERLNLTAAVGVAGTAAGWLTVVFCEPAHLTSDTLDLRYWTGTVADAGITREQVIA
jgi:hypothetical protein